MVIARYGNAESKPDLLRSKSKAAKKIINLYELCQGTSVHPVLSARLKFDLIR